MAEVTGVDKDRKRVLLGEGTESIPYDYLIVATGVHGSYFGHDDWAPFAPTMKTLADAEALRRRIVSALEQADQTADPALRGKLLTFVLGGRWTDWLRVGGRTGRPFPSLAASRVQTHRSTPGPHHPGRGRAAGRCRPSPKAWLAAQSENSLWTACVAASPAGRWLAAETDRAGRVIVKSDLSIEGSPDIFVVGDTAHIENGGKVLPGVAQVALQSGKHAAHTIRARITNEPRPAAFSYFDKGNMATIASTYAIIEKDRLKVGGMFGKAGWAVIHVLYLGRAEGQRLLFLQWLFGILFGRTGSRYIDTPAIEAAPGTPRQLTRTTGRG
jgi:NADH dehydrogenase